MALPNIFTAGVADLIIDRINNLKPSSHANWGKMKVSQMLAHCNVTYERHLKISTLNQMLF